MAADSPVSPIKGDLTGDLLLDDLKRKTKYLRDNLSPIMNEAQRDIEEEAFVKYFLPLFAGEYKNDKQKYTEAFVAWIRVAGSPYAAVNVVANGQIVAIVPPIRNNILTGKPTAHTQDIGSVFLEAQQFATISPARARNFIAEALHHRYMTRIPRPDLTADQKAWFVLLNRYNKAPESFSLPEGDNSKTSSADNKKDDDFEY
jgi:hypothetical protein